MRQSICLKFAAFACLLFSCGRFAARADVLFSNLNQTVTGGTAGATSPSFRYATDFQTGQYSGTVTSLTTDLENQDTQSHTYTASIFTDAMGKPGALVGSFNTFMAAGNETSPSTVTTASSGVSLSSASTYWLVWHANENSAQSTELAMVITSSQQTDAGSVFSTVPSTNLKTSTDGGSSYVDSGAGNFEFALGGTQVPEPSSSTLVTCFGGISLAACFRFQKRRSGPA